MISKTTTKPVTGKNDAPAVRKPRIAKKDASGKTKAAPYHHGTLNEALLKAAETVLERDGLPGLTLRAVAREAGVSHAAPAHHFGDLTGLLSELAAIGFRRFNEALAAASRDAKSPGEMMEARGIAYVAFARAYPGLYQLMFRTERLDMSRPSLSAAATAALAGLTGAAAASRHEPISKDALTLAQAGNIVWAWSLVHGFASLLIDGRLEDILERIEGGADADTLLGAMLRGARPPAAPPAKKDG
ncbi:MAG TPA: TetR/AcrR family transcriptional regulator [Xanthobacteraceae bacterium]|nr:TetR/AcrR family transcriptional regulator [Xanthobacteraceae bacterium]